MSASDYEILDPSFRRSIRFSAKVERLFDGCIWAEGPVYFAAHRSLVWSDIPNDRMLRYDECSGQVSVFRSPSNYSNGNSVDRNGRLLSCEQGSRSVTRTEHDGRIVTLADRFEGKRFNSPNDLVEHSDGSIWFTDPTYGIDSDYEGRRSEPELDGSHVYRIAPGGEVARVLDDFVKPNGLAFSPDETRLYVADTGASHKPDGPRHIRAFDVEAGRIVRDRGVFAETKDAAFDGFRLDDTGRVWTSAGDAVNCYTPEGELVGRILFGETVSNLVFGGPKRNRLYITATSSLYTVLTATNGCKTY